MTYRQSIKIVIFTIVLGLGWIIGVEISRLGKYEVSVRTIPSDTTTVVDGKMVKGNGSIFVSPGEYNLVGSRPGFSDDSITIQVDEDTTAIILPNPNSPEAEKFLFENPQVQIDRETLGGIREQQQGEDFRDNNPITTVLPYKGVLFQINYANDAAQENGIVVQVAANASYKRTLAIQKIIDLGYSPTDYKIEYIGVLDSAPFVSTEEILDEDRYE